MHWKTPTSTRIKKSKAEEVGSEDNDLLLWHQIEWVPEGQTVNQKYYLEVLIKLLERVKKNRTELWKKESWSLHQDNAAAHNALSVKQFLDDKCTPVLQHHR
jgi:hypothetical protein